MIILVVNSEMLENVEFLEYSSYVFPKIRCLFIPLNIEDIGSGPNR